MQRAHAAATVWLCAFLAILMLSFAATPAGSSAAQATPDTTATAAATTAADTPVAAATATLAATVGVIDTPAADVTPDTTAPAVPTDAPGIGPADTPAAGAPTDTPQLPANELTPLPQAISSEVPDAVATGNAAGPGNNGGDNGGQNPDNGGVVPPDSTASQDSSPPWLLIVGGLVIVVLAAIALLAYSRRSANPARATATPVDPAATTTLTPPAKGATKTAPMPVPAPDGQIRCPNCGTLNPADRRYCDECGQDLRAAATPAAAAAAAANAATPATGVLDENQLPYLETLNRPVEQLEYVLTRDVINIGRAGDNDIVIDEQFIGWPTVSQHHARLHREGGEFILEDLNSENGTFVNGARTGQNVMEDGMTISIGKVDFIYRLP